MTQSQPFTQFVSEIRRGKALVELSDKLGELVTAVDQHREPGTLTFTVTIKPDGDGQVTITDTIKAKIPEGKRPPSIFYYDEHGRLSRTDPRQMEISDEVARRREREAAS
jgi:hypothetical protein